MKIWGVVGIFLVGYVSLMAKPERMLSITSSDGKYTLEIATRNMEITQDNLLVKVLSHIHIVGAAEGMDSYKIQDFADHGFAVGLKRNGQVSPNNNGHNLSIYAKWVLVECMAKGLPVQEVRTDVATPRTSRSFEKFGF